MSELEVRRTWGRKGGPTVAALRIVVLSLRVSVSNVAELDEPLTVARYGLTAAPGNAKLVMGTQTRPTQPAADPAKSP